MSLTTPPIIAIEFILTETAASKRIVRIHLGNSFIPCSIVDLLNNSMRNMILVN